MKITTECPICGGGTGQAKPCSCMADARNTDLTVEERTAIINRFWPSRVDRAALHLMLLAAADLALEKYLGTTEPAPTEITYPDLDPQDPHPDKTDAELGFAYRMMLRAAHNGLVVNFISGDISLPKKG